MKAYALLTITKAAADSGILEGVASTPTPDRVGDVVEPAGARFKLPLPLLWQHDKSDPIGHVIDAQITPQGIRIRAQVAKNLDERIGRYWSLLKSGLVRGLSVGFRGLQSEPIGRTGIRYKSWEWLELSAVTIPANTEASVLAVKAADARLVEFARLAKGPDYSKPAPVVGGRVVYFDR